VADEHVKVWSDRLPHAPPTSLGSPITSSPGPTTSAILRDDLAATGDFARDELAAMPLMELLRLDGAEPLARTTTIG